MFDYFVKLVLEIIIKLLHSRAFQEELKPRVAIRLEYFRLRLAALINMFGSIQVYKFYHTLPYLLLILIVILGKDKLLFEFICLPLTLLILKELIVIEVKPRGVKFFVVIEVFYNSVVECF